ncbi:hypothetical protein TWF569_009814 [Orbilia oligospora]|uniref:NACHT domain-containing protein n=1 Tax=Orbilia oligospora TaxID=2813651 RepID=A0A7C8K3I3_ORBOL|nr:hypothetical protein TWF706_006680 [Orbilia oligospora]KAF3112731.1 hypothetical protein TWF102_004127 [Orbilia oligospora]KAF3117658.1 hypothetical protein TWF103_004339 [Orbilia oligospora]KAF3142827.1 hypothetical protein TWF703_000331 [Orbilia oligospora]KAF3152051.1 hypothetical protein TWF594_005806 [Orbilia oligospora]
MDPIPGTFHNQEANVGLQANSVNITGGVTINGANAAAASQKEKEIKILGALHKSIEKNRKDRNPDRVPGTCKWFTTHQTFRDWKSSPSSKMLWVSADPGSGKSVLAKYLVDSILPSTEERTTCYFFFKDDFEGQGSAVTALCCILYQLFSKKRTLLSREIIERFEIAGEGFSSNFTELWNAFIIAIKDNSAGEVVCILDALDECKGNERSELIGKLQQLYREKNKSNIKFLVTSRPIFEIRNGLHHQEIPESSLIHLSGESEAEILKISQEIGIFIEARVEGIGEKAGLTRAERSILLGKLTSVKNRTYLWVYLTLNLIESDPRMNIGISENRVQNITSHLPTTVNEAYERILSSSRDLGEAKLLLKILIAAARPLRLREMRLAMQLAAGDNYHSYKELGMIMGQSEQRIRDYIRDLCGLFVVVIESAVYLIHQTAKEFLVSNNRSGADQCVGQSLQWRNSLHVWDCHLVLFYACARHLFFAEFESDPLSSEESVPEYCEKYVFLDYSANHWAAHLRNSRINLVGREAEWILGLCDPTSKRCITWFRVYWAGTNTTFPSGATALIIASYFGLLNVVKLLLKSRLDERAGINGVDGEYGRPALSWAAENGFDDVIKALLKVPRWKGISVVIKKKAKVNILDVYRRTPLTYAVWGRHIAVIKQLLEAGARVDLGDDIGGTPISYAICSGSDDVIKQLLKRADEIDSRDLIVTELFLSASQKGRDDVVRLLLGTGNIDIESRDRSGRTALMKSVLRGRYHVALLLINNGAKIEAADEDGWTPLILAVRKRHEKIVQLLLERNANIEVKDNAGQTPLMHAAINTQPTPIEQVFGGRDTEAMDSTVSTSLMFTINWEHRGVVGLLLERGADVNAADERGWTPVLHAADSGYDESARVLLGRMDHARCWKVVLKCWLRTLNERMVRVLLRSGLDTEAADEFGRTPLARAIEMDYTDLAEILVNGGANMEAADRDGMTPLALAVLSESWEVAGLLLDKGASARTTDHNGCTPLHRAVHSHDIFNEQILSRLLANGADIEAPDANGFTPLFRAVDASKHHHYSVNGVRALIERGASINTRIIRGEPYSLLYEAVGANNLLLVELLLDKGADIEEGGKWGPTPLFYALRTPNLFGGILKSLLWSGAKREVKGAKGQTLMACVEPDAYGKFCEIPEYSSLRMVEVQDKPGGPWTTKSIHNIKASDYL